MSPVLNVANRGFRPRLLRKVSLIFKIMLVSNGPSNGSSSSEFLVAIIRQLESRS